MNKNIINKLIEVKASNATTLDLSGLGLTFIPEEVFELKFLTSLDLSNNEIEEISDKMLRLENMKQLNLDNNPIKNIPYEIIHSGVDAIFRYLKEVSHTNSSNQLFEAKLLLVGEGGVGKTTLQRKLLDINAPLPKEDETTRGIDISQLEFDSEEEQRITINIWDFGGQEVYSGTHQLFLTQNSLYALVVDSRREDNNFNYWLNAIEILGGDSPIIIVANEKHDRSVIIDEMGLRSRFPNLVGIIKSNFLTGRGLYEVAQEIRHQIQKLPHLGAQLPNSWLKIRKKLEDTSRNEDFIGIDRYFEICREFEKIEKQGALLLSRYFHEIGILFHFQENPLLRKIIILNPTWLTNAIYKLIDDYQIRINNGQFDREKLKHIWHEPEYSYVEDEILEIMSEFELCYQVDKNKYILPQLLPFDRPDFEWDTEGVVTVKYFYSFMPKGILNRLIVRMHRYINNDCVWNSGVQLKRNNAFALIIQQYFRNEITISIKGDDSKDLLAIVLENIDTINASYRTNLKVQKMIPCNCHICKSGDRPHYYDFDSLKRRIEKGRDKIECENSFDMVSVRSLLGEYEKPSISESEILNNTLRKFGINIELLGKGGEDDK